ncbi:MAG: SMP-30/gluconolactonase/LRE family protein, partial [Comamonas sp.]
LFWVDIPARQIWRWRAGDAAPVHWQLPEQVGCIAPATQGRWVCGLETGVALATLAGDGGPAQLEFVATVEHPLQGMRFNDGRCDRQGRFRAGTMLQDMAAARAVGTVYGLDSAGQQDLQPLHGALLTPNGMAFSPDGRTMYLSDSHPLSQQIWQFDYDPSNGRMSRQRLFVDMNQHPGRPDGAAVDEDGCYWICANDAGLLLRFTPAGQLDRSIPVPVSKPSMCAFGGVGLDTLFVTTIRLPGTPADSPAGGVFALRPGVRGIAETEFPA